MDGLIEVIEKLQDTNAAIAQVERAITEHPLPSVLSTLNTLRKRQRDLEGQFSELAASKGVDVCSYKLFPDEKIHERPTLGSLTKTLTDFQTLFTQVYYSLKENKPHDTARVTPEIAQESAFGFAYTFSSSVGVVLTLPNERLLFGASEIDEAMENVFGLVKADSPQSILAHVKKLGVAPVRTLYKWANDQVMTGLSSEIEWRREDSIRSSVLVQYPELEKLIQTIESSSEEKQIPVELAGQLVGADFKTRTFHMIFDDGPEIRGRIADDIGTSEPVTWPKIYKAQLIKTTKIHYSTDKEDVSWFLVALST